MRIGFSLAGRTVVAGIFLLAGGAGCSDLHGPQSAKDALTHPLGGTGGPFARGTPKAKILASWGPPDHVVRHGADELGTPREEWIYHGRVQALPIDYEYVSRTKRLFFEGEHLVRWSTDEPASAD